MLGGKARGQLELVLAGSLRDLIPDDHVLARVDRVLDLGWLRAEVADCYTAEAGRPGIDPEAAVRLMLAGLLLGFAHDRRLMREAQVNIAIRWFIIRADVSWDAIARRHADTAEAAEGDGGTPRPTAPKPAGTPVCTTDPDATLATNNKARRSEPAYKQHTAADAERGVILDVAVTTGAMHDTKTAEVQLDAVAATTGTKVQVATMDAGHAITRVFAGLEERGIEAVIPAKAERPPKKGTIRTRRALIMRASAAA